MGHTSCPGSSPVLQLYLSHDEGRDIRLQKFHPSDFPGDLLSLLGLRGCLMECDSTNLGVGVLYVGVVTVGAVDSGGVEVGV